MLYMLYDAFINDKYIVFYQTKKHDWINRGYVNIVEINLSLFFL